MSLLTPRPTYAPFEYNQAYRYWELQQQSHWLHCVAGNQKVITSKGIFTVKELYDLGEELELFNNDEKIKSSKMLLTAVRDLYTLHTKEGYTHTITKDHRIMTPNGWTEAQCLKNGDLLCIQTNEGLFGGVDEPELAYLAGHFQGDGTICRNNTKNKEKIEYRWTVWQHEYEFIPKIEKCIEVVYRKFNLIDDRYHIPKFGSEHSIFDSMPKRSLHSMKLSNLNLFTKGKVPEFVWRGTKRTVEEYLTGLFDTDGTCYQGKKHESIKFVQINKEFIQDIQILLSNFGIKSVIYTNEANKRLLPTNIGDGSMKEYQCQASYCLEINNKLAVIKMNNFCNIFEKSGKIFRGFVNEKKSHPIINARFDRLEYIGKDNVYCVEVNTKDHAWICNGFITHNTEISMASDINDWKTILTDAEKKVIGHILKGFTQSEVFIQEYWGQMVAKWFKKPEIQMMAAAFSSMESIHAVAYAYLNQSLGLEDFEAFLHEPTAKAKIDRLINTKGKSKEEIARSLAIFSAFNEGVNLFSSFAVLLNFSRFNKLKGVGQIIAFSIKDESLHSEAGCWLFRTLVSEFPEIMTDDLKKEIYDAARLTVELEDAFIGKAFEYGNIEGIDEKDLKSFIRFRTNTKLGDLGLKKVWKNVDQEALERMSWFDVMSAGNTLADFFASRVSDYSKGVMDFSNIFEEQQ